MDMRPIEALAYDATHDDNDAILAEARARFAAGASVRGLPRPFDAPEDRESWYTLQRRPLADGGTAAYLMLRWRGRIDGKTGRSLGRLN